MNRQQADAMVRKMFPNKNHDKLPYQIGKEYTWKDFETYDDSKGMIPAICKFKVLKTFTDDLALWCKVEYTVGVYKGSVVNIPIEDMPLTVEKR